MMKRFLCLLLSLMIGAPPVFGWGARGHEMSARVAAGALPKDMPEFFRRAGERLAYLCPEPDRWFTRSTPALAQSNAPDHYFNLEAWGADPLPPARYDLIFAAAKRGIVGEGKPVNGLGTAPVVVAELAGRLVANFRHWRESTADTEPARLARQQIEENIIYTAGILGHFVTDLANPLHCTVHHNGWAAGYPNPKSFSAAGSGQNLHFRFEVTYVERAVSEKDLTGRLTQTRRLGAWVPEMEQLTRRNNGFVEQLYLYDQKAAFGSGNEPPEAQVFTAARLADGAAVLRDLWHTAWVVSGEEWLDDRVFLFGRPGRTVLDLLKEGGRRVETRHYEIGEMVVAIGNRKNGLDGRYWHYLVNGKLATDAADRRRTEAGDRIEWRFERHEPSPR